MEIRIETAEKPSHSKGWMAYKVAAVEDKLQYGTTVIPESDGTVTIEVYGEIQRASRREKIHETHTLTLAAGETREVRRNVSSSNRLILSVSAS